MPTTQEKHPTFLDDQRSFFDELITTEWQSYHDPLWDRWRQFEVDCLFERIQAERILDVGCGCGYHDLLMANKPGVTEVVGIDYSAKSVETANRVYVHERVRRQVADIFTLPRGDFDLVVSFQVIEHLRDVGAFLAACRGQARHGGWVVVLTPNRKRIQNRLRTVFGLSPELSDPQHFAEYDIQDLIEHGRSARLEHVAHVGYGLSLSMPKTGWPLFPRRFWLALGARLGSLADRIVVFFRAPH
jgi:SAM-dependent methyltransferase